MTFSTFSQKFYISKYNIKYIDSQHRFISELFYSAGSKFFYNIYKKDSSDNCSEYPKKGDYYYWTLRSLYSGKNALTEAMKESFPQNIDENKFAEYFMERIKDRSLIKIMLNFNIETTNATKKAFLLALARQLQVIIKDDDEIHNIVKDEYIKLISMIDTSKGYKNASKIRLDEQMYSIPPIRLWLPDAELAIEEQSEFANFTMTESIYNFLRSDSNIYGIISSKGVGKTYILQRLRRNMKNVIPYHKKLSKDNEWGMESVRISEPIHLQNADLKQLAGLWQVSVICLILNCLETKNIIEKIKTTKLHVEFIYLIEHSLLYTCLNDIINHITTIENWHNIILDTYTILKSICKQLLLATTKLNDDCINIFIDKVDQSILQPGSEIPECEKCYKDAKVDKCIYKDKGSKYCFEECRECCFGCEIFLNKYSGRDLRVYDLNYNKRYEHISRWQHLQLALVYAVYNIQYDFNYKIRIYYSVRQEAFNVEYNILGGNAHKIKAHTIDIQYSKEEQEKIFINTIKVQPNEYLYNHSLISERGRESEAFVGIKELCHPHVNAKETLFECIYRHSFDRAREIQYLGEALSLKIHELRNIDMIEKREELVKTIIEKTSAELLFDIAGVSSGGNKTYYNDKQILLKNYWANPENFKNFIQEIDRNLLFISDLVNICRKINNFFDCNFNSCNQSNCDLHPFSMLYQLGLLGRASYNTSTKSNIKQYFIDSKNITYYKNDEILFPNEETIYIIHPALTKCIERKIRGVSILHFKGFILGKDLTIDNNTFNKLIQDKRNMDAKLFEEKYYSKTSTISN